MKIPANGFTHAGKFHADDVFATALLQILRPDIKITRGFVVPDDFDGIVYDIGFGMFDHHQEPREYRANGVPYAAFGLLWRVLGPGLVGERQARLIDENFIQPLDLNDNTGEQNSLCDAIGFFNPVWDSKEDQDACFFQAVAVAKQILEHQIDAANAVNRADEKVQQAYRNSRDGIVYDIGVGMFDHHQEPREYRANGVPYAAFGLLWRVLGPGLVGERQARLIDENFIQPLDLNDNTGEQNSLCDAIGFFNPVWDSKEDQDSCFFKAVAVAKQILENQIDSANAVNRADEKVQQAYRSSRDGIVVLPCYLPWKNGLYKTDALFVVYPSQRGGWSAQCVTDHKTKKSKLPFPQSWAGQPQEVIEQKSGIPGISFCHASRFLITAKDKETALAACRQVLKNNGRLA